VAIEQDSQAASFAYNISSEEEKVDWTKTNQAIDQLIRALNPKPIAYTLIGEQRYKIGEVKVLNNQDYNDALPGTILDFDEEGIIVQTGKGLLKIVELQRPGKKMQLAKIYFQNKSLKDLKVGTKFS
jgi:methionyl-tRNA formyltransferase